MTPLCDTVVTMGCRKRSVFDDLTESGRNQPRVEMRESHCPNPSSIRCPKSR